ncbi:MAG: hypothetical protein AB7I34_23550 [Rhizobiaceae bacterium]
MANTLALIVTGCLLAVPVPAYALEQEPDDGATDVSSTAPASAEDQTMPPNKSPGGAGSQGGYTGLGGFFSPEPSVPKTPPPLVENPDGTVNIESSATTKPK